MGVTPTRRTFLECAASAGCLSFVGGAGRALGQQLETGLSPAVVELGSLYPFVESRALHGRASLSFLQPRFDDAALWKREARGKLFELLHYAPPQCAPRAEVVE